MGTHGDPSVCPYRNHVIHRLLSNHRLPRYLALMQTACWRPHSCPPCPSALMHTACWRPLVRSSRQHPTMRDDCLGPSSSRWAGALWGVILDIADRGVCGDGAGILGGAGGRTCTGRGEGGSCMDRHGKMTCGSSWCGLVFVHIHGCEAGPLQCQLLRAWCAPGAAASLLHC